MVQFIASTLAKVACDVDQYTCGAHHSLNRVHAPVFDHAIVTHHCALLSVLLIIVHTSLFYRILTVSGSADPCLHIACSSPCTTLFCGFRPAVPITQPHRRSYYNLTYRRKAHCTEDNNRTRERHTPRSRNQTSNTSHHSIKRTINTPRRRCCKQQSW